MLNSTFTLIELRSHGNSIQIPLAIHRNHSGISLETHRNCTFLPPCRFPVEFHHSMGFQQNMPELMGDNKVLHTLPAQIIVQWWGKVCNEAHGKWHITWNWHTIWNEVWISLNTFEPPTELFELVWTCLNQWEPHLSSGMAEFNLEIIQNTLSASCLMSSTVHMGNGFAWTAKTTLGHLWKLENRKS